MLLQQTGRPEEDAAALLRTLDAADQFPVDPISLARQLGIAVYVGGTDFNTAGMLIKQRGRDAEIFINSADSKRRQRFTCAHELGHFVRRSGLGPEDWEARDERGFTATTGRNTEERYANGFAAALLMPADDVKKQYDDEMSLGHMLKRYDVSLEAMQNRVQNLGLPR